MNSVWVFNGGGDFPAAVFTTRELAEAWIAGPQAHRRADQVPVEYRRVRVGHRLRGVQAQAAGPVRAAVHCEVQFREFGALPLRGRRRTKSCT